VNQISKLVDVAMNHTNGAGLARRLLISSRQPLRLMVLVHVRFFLSSLRILDGVALLTLTPIFLDVFHHIHALPHATY
jgi:hypothetical protein